VERTRTSRWSKALAAAFCVGLALIAAGEKLARSSPGATPEIPQAKGLPRLVFVRGYRHSLRGGRTDETSFGEFAFADRGLFVREPNGTLHPLLTEPHFHDVAHPVPSWDAKTIVFAGQVAADSAWRIWTVGADGRGLRPVTRTDRTFGTEPLGAFAVARFSRYDDFDPAWLPDGRIVFASTRFPQVAQA